jgi:hypothetical protein
LVVAALILKGTGDFIPSVKIFTPDSISGLPNYCNLQRRKKAPKCFLPENQIHSHITLVNRISGCVLTFKTVLGKMPFKKTAK